ncbi:MAG: hypothetical protein HY334_01360, partial [Armatimonadetes bacterium]|nr:hypothetical protein [Armatimonadota bacterium]
LGLIIIDYLQMIHSYKRTENRTQEISEIARATKSLAKELNVPVIAISQLSRAVEMLGNRRPQLSHLRECVTADTVVWDADTGRRHRVGELAGREEWPRLLSLDRRGRLVPVRPSAVLEKGDNEVFEIRTSTGRRLKATANHPILTPEGWKKVSAFKPGDLVGAARRLPVFRPQPPQLNADRMRLLGYLVGDGSYQRRQSISFISADPHTLEEDPVHLGAVCNLIGIEGRKDRLVSQCLAELATRRHKPQRDRLPYSATEELWKAKAALGVTWRELGFRLQRRKTLDRPRAALLAERRGNERISRMASSDLLWDRVTSVSPIGKEAVFDLVMPGTHNFVANGLIIHNSGELEQVADLVLFIYREDYYNEQTEKKNIAEIHIAKHRNGPTGTIELYFDREHSRFIGLDRRRSGPGR